MIIFFFDYCFIFHSGDASSDANWALGPPWTFDCGFFHASRDRWFDGRCSFSGPFICYSDNLRLVKENKTWEEALEHCRAMGSADPGQHNAYREHQYDLVSLQSQEDHRYARDRIQEATTQEVERELLLRLKTLQGVPLEE